MAREKSPLPTSREVYNTIRWDPRHDAGEFVVVYEERFAGEREVPLLEFSPDGEIPWHRVWAIRRGSDTVWDRRARIYRLHAPKRETIQVETPSSEPEGSLRPQSLTVLHPRSASGPACPGLLRVASLNVLDPTLAYDIPSGAREQAIFSLLRELDADLVGLQEVTRSFMDTLLVQPWVRERYSVCPLPPQMHGGGHGQLLLSRLPVREATSLSFSPHKQLLLAQVERSGETLKIAVLHLSSNRAKQPQAQRARQLRIVREQLDARAGDSLVLGDFNCGDDELEPLQRAGWSDIWTELRPDEPGVSFDPKTNPLAHRTSASGLQRRYDRVLWRSAGTRMRAVDVRLFGDRPLPERWRGGALFPSDHYGVVACLRDRASLPAGLDAQPSYRSAIALIPPESVWSPIQAIRAEYDRSYSRWMPHINLIYGFIPDEGEDFEAAARLVGGALAQLEPFALELGSFGQFNHKGGATLWLDPEALPDAAVLELQGVLQRLFPQCDELSKRSSAGYRPHMTVASFSRRTRRELPALRRTLEAEWEALEFPVGAVALISRRDDEPFEIRALVPIGRGVSGPEQLEAQIPAWSEEQRSERAELVQAVRSQCEALVAGSEVHVSGSTGAGLDLPGSDLDLVWVCPAGCVRERVFSDLHEVLAADPRVRALARVEGHGHTLRCVFAGHELDLQLAVAPKGAGVHEPQAWTSAQLEQLPEVDGAAIKSLRDLAALESHGRALGAWASMQAATKLLKAWARARDLDCKALGFMGGISWAVIAGWALARAERPPPTLGATMVEIFVALCEWEGHEALTLEGPAAASEWARSRRDRLPVLSAARPRVNTARHLTPSTARVLQREWQRARQIVEVACAGTSPGLWQPLLEPLAQPRGRCIELHVNAERPEELSRVQGWLRGQVLGLILELERRCDAQLRPRAGKRDEPWFYCLELEHCEATDAQLRAVIDDFVARAEFPSGWLLARLESKGE